MLSCKHLARSFHEFGNFAAQSVDVWVGTFGAWANASCVIAKTRDAASAALIIVTSRLKAPSPVLQRGRLPEACPSHPLKGAWYGDNTNVAHRLLSTLVRPHAP